MILGVGPGLRVEDVTAAVEDYLRRTIDGDSVRLLTAQRTATEFDGIEHGPESAIHRGFSVCLGRL